MIKDSNKINFLLLAILFAVGSSIWIVKEGFGNLTSGNYPTSVTYPLLYPDYPEKKNPGISNLGSQQLWSYYPVFGNSYAQYTNNVRYWATPNNGQCSPGSMCGGLYNPRTVNIPPPPPPPSWNSDDIRVNYYDSSVLSC